MKYTSVQLGPLEHTADLLQAYQCDDEIHPPRRRKETRAYRDLCRTKLCYLIFSTRWPDKHIYGCIIKVHRCDRSERPRVARPKTGRLRITSCCPVNLVLWVAARRVPNNSKQTTQYKGGKGLRLDRNHAEGALNNGKTFTH